MVINVRINTLLDIHIQKSTAFPSPLCTKFSQMNAYVKYFDKNSKYINLSVNDEEVLKKYREIWNKIKN